jgi:hypothetical protein
VRQIKRLLTLITLATVIAVTIGYGQTGGNGPFSTPAPPAGNGGTYSPNGGGGIGPDDIGPPPDPIDTPLDAGIIYLLILGVAYGVTRMRKEENGGLKKA